MSTMMRAALGFFAGISLAVVLGVAIGWSTLERELSPWAVERALHATDVAIDSVRDDAGALVLGQVVIRSSDGTVVLHAGSVRVNGGALALAEAALDANRPIDVAVSDAHVDIALAALEPAVLKRTLSELRSGAGSRRLAISVARGSATIGDPDEPGRLLALANLHGFLNSGNRGTTYDVAGQEIARDVTYPFEASSDYVKDGVTQHTFAAPALALQPLLGVIPASGIVVRGGYVRDLSLTIGTSADAPPAVTGSGLFVHVAGSLEGAASRPFSEADGRFRIDGSHLVIPTLTASLGKAALDAYGEIGDIPASPRWLESGTRELALAGRTLDAIAGQPDVDRVDLDIDAPGIIFAHYHMANPLGPRSISLVAIDPKVPGVRLDTGLAEDTIVSGGERTSALANRTEAVAGINGDYFDIGRSYQPQGMLMTNGKLLRSPADRATLSVHHDGSVTFGEYHCEGSLATPEGKLRLSEYNDWPAGFGTVVTPEFGKTLREAPGETFVGLEPVDAASRSYRVSEVTPSEGELPARFGVGVGAENRGALPRSGETVKLTYGCSPSLGDTVAILGGGPQLVKDGEWYEDPHPPAPDERPVRWPVVALASMSDGTLAMVAVDGRHPERALGMSRPEFADLLRSLGASDAMAFDSGGSVTLVSRKPGDKIVSVRNRPSDDNGERWISDGLFVYSDRPAPALTEAPAIVPSASESALPGTTATPLETIVNPDLPGSSVVTSSPGPSPSAAPTP